VKDGPRHASEVSRKPGALRDSGLTTKHGTDEVGYDGVEKDPLGFNMHYLVNGKVHGNGIYFGLSDHVAAAYNKVGKPGTALIGLMLTHDSIAAHTGSYTTFSLLTPKPGVKNCIVVHEPALVLVLGKVVAL